LNLIVILNVLKNSEIFEETSGSNKLTLFRAPRIATIIAKEFRNEVVVMPDRCILSFSPPGKGLGLTTTSFLNSFAMMVAILGALNKVSLLDPDVSSKISEFFKTLSITIKFISRVWDYKDLGPEENRAAGNGQWFFDWNNLPIFSCIFLKGYFTYLDLGDLNSAYYCPLLPSRIFKATAGTNTPPSKIVVGRRKQMSCPDAAAVLYMAATVLEYRKFAHDHFTQRVMEQLCPGEMDTYLERAMTKLNYNSISYNTALTITQDSKFQEQKSYTQRQQKAPRSHGRNILISGEGPCYAFMEDRYGVTTEEIKNFLGFLNPSEGENEGYSGRTYIAHPFLAKLFDADY
jgi:hypothetical protein